MLLGGRLKKFIARRRAERISDWLRAGIVSLLSVIIVLLIAQWATLFSVVFVLHRAHLTEVFKPLQHEFTMPGTATIIRDSNRPDIEAAHQPKWHNSLTLAYQTV
ncbi:MAG: hypothetical protein ABJH63_15020 [Rhizobiaceae bacterium]